MDVRLPSPGGRAGRAWLKVALAVAVLAIVLAPALLWAGWVRLWSTVLFVLLFLVVWRAFLAAVVSVHRLRPPPEKPDGVGWPFVSVLVPAYNEAAVLPRAMASMREIDYPADRVEFVYVYEKRCTDATPDIIRSFVETDPRFRAVERDVPKGGKAAAANFGLDHCRGEFIVSLDADHVLDPGALKRAIRWMLSDASIGCVKGRVIGENIRASYLALQAKVERDAVEKGEIYSRQVMRSFTFFGGGQAIFRRTVFADVGLFDESVLTEDSEFSVRMHAAGWRILIDPAVVTWEENPPDLLGWWAQRERWARGWMQVAVRYLPRLWRMERMPWRERLDLAHTLVFCVVPVACLLLGPLWVLTVLGVDTRTYLGSWTQWAWMVYAFAPAALSVSIALQDLRDGVPRTWRELPAMVTLWGYVVFQTAVFWSAFVDEFILRRPSVYVKTVKSGTGLRAVKAAALRLDRSTRRRGRPERVD